MLNHTMEHAGWLIYKYTVTYY